MQGFNNIQLSERDKKMDKIDEDRNFLLFQEMSKRNMNHVYSFLLTGLETSNMVLELSTRQWKTFMTEKRKWMGNVAIENGVITPYDGMNPLLLTIFTKSVFRTQQERSYYLNLVEKEDIWDSKNMFSNEIRRAILKANFETTSMENLISKVIEHVKLYIIKERPNGIMEPAWRIFYSSVHKSSRMS